MNDNKWSVIVTDMLYAMLAGIGFGILAVLIKIITDVIYLPLRSPNAPYFWDLIINVFSIIAFLGIIAICGVTVGYYCVKKGYQLEDAVSISSIGGIYFSLLQVIPLIKMNWRGGQFQGLDFVDLILPISSIFLVMLSTNLFVNYAISRGIGKNGKKLTFFKLKLSDEKWPVKIVDILLAITAGIGFSFLTFPVLMISEAAYYQYYITWIDGILYITQNIIPIELVTFYCLCIIILCSLIMGYYYQNKGYKQITVVLLCGLAGLFTALFQPDSLNIIHFLSDVNYEPLSLYNVLSNVVMGLSMALLTTYLLVKLTAVKNSGPQRKALGTIAIFTIILLMIIPILIMTTSNMIVSLDKQPYGVKESLQDVRRTADNTIVISNVGVPESLEYYLNDVSSDKTFVILLNGTLDVSNSTEINKTGLNISIDPSTGLGYKQGQKVTFSGPDISNVNNTSFLIFLHYNDSNRYFGYNNRFPNYFISGWGWV